MLMLGRYTFLFDYAHRLPVLGSSREPVRFHVWVSLGVAALAADGVERLGRPGAVSLESGLVLAGVLVAVSIPIMIYIYARGLDPAQSSGLSHTTLPDIAGWGASSSLPRLADRASGDIGLVGRAVRRGCCRPGPPGAAGRDPAAIGPGRSLHAHWSTFRRSIPATGPSRRHRPSG